MPYLMPMPTGLASHFPAPSPLARDADEDFRIEVRVRSGDYLHTLATEIERLAQYLAPEQLPEVEDLERLASELLYVNRRYELTRKK
jgi:tRNA U55 pseudouridine synthase TruB